MIYFTEQLPLRKKCPNTEFFLIRIWTLFKQCAATHSFRGYRNRLFLIAGRLLFVTKKVTIIHSLKNTVFILTGDLAAIRCLVNLSVVVCLFPKKLVQLCVLS